MGIEQPLDNATLRKITDSFIDFFKFQGYQFSPPQQLIAERAVEYALGDVSVPCPSPELTLL